ncbi:MAG: nitroreductase [Nevskia sp.]|nr:nitroreductase [Nevskia sp.]
MNVSEAVLGRRSVRAFRDTPVPRTVLEEVLAKAARAPSGGNVQPWQLYVLSGEPLGRFKAQIGKRLAQSPMGEPPLDYEVYPKGLKAPYRDYRFKNGEDLYGLLGIPRQDKFARLAWFSNNFRFFGAPVGLFCFIDRQMGPPQWSDLGMYLQTLMLLLREAGLDSCPQECWSIFHRTVQDFLGAPQELMLFCGMAIGYADETAAVNRLETDRAPLQQFCRFLD